MNLHRLAGLARIVGAFILLAAAPAAFAGGTSWDRWLESRGHHGGPHGGTYHSTPEFDPAAGGALAVLLAGGAMFVANRRRSK